LYICILSIELIVKPFKENRHNWSESLISFAILFTAICGQLIYISNLNIYQYNGYDIDVVLLLVNLIILFFVVILFMNDTKDVLVNAIRKLLQLKSVTTNTTENLASLNVEKATEKAEIELQKTN